MILTEMSWPEVRDYLDKKPTVAIVPVGSTEQHSLHLPLGTDHILALEGAKDIAKQLEALVVPVTSVGCSAHHMGFPGTLTLRQETLSQILFEAGESLSKHGFGNIVYFSAHAGNDKAVELTVERVNRELEIKAIGVLIRDVIKSFPEGYVAKLDLHAGVVETSYMLFSRPELVRMDKAKKPNLKFPEEAEAMIPRLEQDPGLLREMGKFWVEMSAVTDTGSLTYADPAKATSELGREFHQRLTKNTVSFLRRWIEH